ncbi:LysR family transcriptional regulator [Parasalinivibrio latis]|uniref:LysR family transcriptional regulator n=1 Tax=Parasalinivibrio latis TaxID=2952610 RepID=UPI0030DFB797
MRLRQIEIFYAVMSAGTLSGAARLLHVSQPNITRVLAHTEQQLGFPLFERHKGRLFPTPEAKRLLPEAEAVYRQISQLNAVTVQLEKGQQHIRIGAAPILASKLVAPVIAQYRANRELTYDLVTDNRDGLIQQLRENRIDLGVVFGDSEPHGTISSTLLTRQFVLVTPKGQIKPPFSLTEILRDRRCPLVKLDTRDPLGQYLQTRLPDWGEIYSEISVQSYMAAAELAVAGAGIAIIDPWTASYYAALLDIYPLGDGFTFPVSIVRAAHIPLSQPARMLMSALEGDLQPNI